MTARWRRSVYLGQPASPTLDDYEHEHVFGAVGRSTIVGSTAEASTKIAARPVTRSSD